MPAISSAVEWIAASVTSSVATMILSIAVACFGMSMLAGHLSARRGLFLVLGCFILTGSAQIAGSMMGSIARQEAIPALPQNGPIEIVELPPLGPEPAPLPPVGNPFDPYAGTKPVQ